MLSKQLLQWHSSANDRILPWKQEKDPYKIWLSEILLQQTRAQAVIPYYQKFVAVYPTIIDLANASDDEVFLLWQGLGYYSRCRNLLATARVITAQYAGVFPNTFDTIIALKGIGTYTASAIASFAFNLPYAVLDGNVYRILARLMGVDTPIDSTEGKKFFQQTADELLPRKKPALYNQAIMDLGATICIPQKPLCHKCPWQASCIAFAQNEMHLYPVKSKKLIIKKRYFHYFVFDDGKNLYLRKRIIKDVWQDLHEFAMQESENEIIEKGLLQPSNNIVQLIQQLTHQKIHGFFYRLSKKPTKIIQQKYTLQKVAYHQLKNYAFPKMIVDYLTQQGFL